MAALDTNVLVRYIVQDDVAEHAAADALIEGALINGEPLLVPVSVTLNLNGCFALDTTSTNPPLK